MNKKLEKNIAKLSTFASKRIGEKIFESENILINQDLVKKFIYPECSAICSIIYNISNLDIVFINSESLNSKSVNNNFLQTLYSDYFLIKVCKILEKKYKLISNQITLNKNEIVEKKRLSNNLSLIIKKILFLIFIKTPKFLVESKSKIGFQKRNIKKNILKLSNQDFELDKDTIQILIESNLINFFVKIISKLQKKSLKKNEVGNLKIYGESIQFNYSKRYEYIFSSNFNIVYQHGGLRGITNYRRLNLEYFSNIYLSFYNEKLFNNKSEKILSGTKILGKSPIIKIDKFCNEFEYFLSNKKKVSPKLVFYLSNHDLNKSYIDQGIVLNPKKTIEHNKLINKMISFSISYNIDISIRSRPGRLNNSLLNKFSFYESNLISNRKSISVIDHPGRILIERIESKCPLIFWGDPEDYDLTLLGIKLFEKLDEFKLILRTFDELKNFMKDFNINQQNYLKFEKYIELFKWYDTECSGGNLFGLYQLV